VAKVKDQNSEFGM